jgi:hypothetical protein
LYSDEDITQMEVFPTFFNILSHFLFAQETVTSREKEASSNIIVSPAVAQSYGVPFQFRLHFKKENYYFT